MMAGMITVILTGLVCGVRTQRSLVLENLALRHQLAILQRTASPPARVDAAADASHSRFVRLNDGVSAGAGGRRVVRSGADLGPHLDSQPAAALRACGAALMAIRRLSGPPDVVAPLPTGLTVYTVTLRAVPSRPGPWSLVGQLFATADSECP
jgi:hypothetical protein